MHTHTPQLKNTQRKQENIRFEILHILKIFYILNTTFSNFANIYWIIITRTGLTEEDN